MTKKDSVDPFDEWFGSEEFRRDYRWYLREKANEPPRDRERWDREAANVRQAADRLVDNPDFDPRVTELLVAMLDAEDAGIGRWDEDLRDWVHVTRRKDRTNRRAGRRPLTESDLSRFEKLRSTRREVWVARCPAHQDRTPSLSIRRTEAGRWLLHCHAGCWWLDVLAAVGLGDRDLAGGTGR